MLGKLARPDFAGVARGEAPDGEPRLAYSLHTEDGRTIRYRYYSEAEPDAPTPTDTAPSSAEMATAPPS